MAKRAHAAIHPSAEAVFLARHQDAVQTTREDIFEVTGETRSNVKDDGVVEHTRPDRVTVYKQSPSGWRPVEIPSTNLAVALANGMRETCGDCGGFCDVDPNSCPGKPKRLLRRCPICSKKIFDYKAEEVEKEKDASSPYEIKDEAYEASTPERRTKTLLDRHLRWYHTSEAETMGVDLDVERQVGV